MKEIRNTIYLIEDGEATTEFPAGYYFSDEAEQLNGPYPTEDAAILAQTEYASYLNFERSADDAPDGFK